MIKKEDTLVQKLYIPERMEWEYTMTWNDWASKKFFLTSSMLMLHEPNKIQNAIDKWHKRELDQLNRERKDDKARED